MPRRQNQPEGLKKMTRDFDIPEQGSGANVYDQDSSRGPLRTVPREGIYRCQVFGGERTSTGGLSSPASGTFAAGKVTGSASERSRRKLAETQIPGSLTEGGFSQPEDPE